LGFQPKPDFFLERKKQRTFFKKFVEFEAEPQGFYVSRVFLEAWKIFMIKKVPKN